MNRDIEEELVKSRILSKNNTFKSAFMATLGFYAGQTVATLLGLLSIGLLVFIVYLIFKSLR